MRVVTGESSRLITAGCGKASEGWGWPLMHFLQCPFKADLVVTSASEQMGLGLSRPVAGFSVLFELLDDPTSVDCILSAARVNSPVNFRDSLIG